MNNLRISAALSRITPFVFLPLFAISGLFAQDQKHKLLWRISSSESSKISYLYGTMHLQDKRIFNFSDSLLPAIERSEVFALELHPDSMSNFMSSGLLDSYTENIYRKILSEEEYEEVDEKFKEVNGVALDDFYTWNPLMVEMSLNDIPRGENDMPNFLDGYLYSLAFSYGAEIKGLEKVVDQLPGPDSIDEQEIRTRILDIVRTTQDEYSDSVEQMIQLYASGDLDAIYEYIGEYDSLDEARMTSRNNVMLTSMLKIMEDRSLFAAVGAAHLPGQNGLIKLLRDSGYTVEPVAVTFNNPPKLEEIAIKTDNWIEHRYDQYGFSIRTPIDVEELEQGPISIYYGIDILSGLSFAYMLSDEIPMNVLSAETLKTFMTIYFKEQDQDMEFVESNEIEINGHSFFEGIIKNSNNEFIRFAVAAEKDYFYALYVQTSKEALRGPNANAFFQSVDFYKAEEKSVYNGQWRTYTNELAGFSVDIPDVEIVDRTNTVENPLDADSDPYKINISYMGDPKLDYNYLIRFNDQPNGYYLIDQKEIITALADELQAGIEVVGEPTPIQEEGLDGFVARLNFFNSYDAVFKFIFRGNRTYAFLVQAKEEGVEVDMNSRFFTSFKVEPLQKSEFESFDFKGLFTIDMPGKPAKVQDEENSPEDEFVETISYARTSTQSGGVYMVEANRLNKFYRTIDTYTYFDELLENMLEYRDSVVSKERIEINGIKALRALLVNPRTNVKQHLQLMYVDDYLINLLTCLGQEEIDQQEHLAFLDSFKYTSTNKSVDLKSSKIKEIVAALNSSDSLRIKNAQGALLYHDLQTEDLDELFKALDYAPIETYGYERSKSDLILPITTYGKKKHLNKLLDYYNKESTAAEVKEEIVSSLLNFKDVKADQVLIDLLLKNPPPRTSDTYYVFYQLEDSLDLLKKYPRQLAQLYKNDNFKDKLVSLYTYKIMEEEDLREDFKELQLAITDDIANQIANYKDSSQVANNFYLNEGLINAYMYIAEIDPSVNAEDSGKIFKAIYTPYAKEPWIKTRALLKALRNGYPVEATVLNEYMEPLYSRYEIMEALVDSEISDLIPAQYTAAEAFTTLSVYNYAGGMLDSYDNSVEKMGELEVEAVRYGIYKVASKSADEEPTMFIAELKAADLSNFKRNEAYTDYSSIDTAWKLQARSLIRKYKREQND